ncbi:hypothetical protein ZHAS_00011517 [Anopheles sinensis]|uniref:Uncharacterized protein n=1 Tax=Anopheles sinensis TaxID=74873 RepID=A0A084W038_ANOSI|nr:hypothetical protein ZHAS_00011517 [Anopheles sinensis]
MNFRCALGISEQSANERNWVPGRSSPPALNDGTIGHNKSRLRFQCILRQHNNRAASCSVTVCNTKP